MDFKLSYLYAPKIPNILKIVTSCIRRLRIQFDLELLCFEGHFYNVGIVGVQVG